jgi:hypothetical protein
MIQCYREPSISLKSLILIFVEFLMMINTQIFSDENTQNLITLASQV